MTIALSVCLPFAAPPRFQTAEKRPAPPRLSVASGFWPSKKRTERTAAVEDASTRSGVWAAVHSLASGVTQVTAGPLTTVMLPEAKAVFGSSSSPTESTFFASWKSAAEADSSRFPPSAPAPAGSGKSAIPLTGSYAAAAIRALAVADHERVRVDAGAEVEDAERDRRPARRDAVRDQAEQRRLQVVHPGAEHVRPGRASGP